MEEKSILERLGDPGRREGAETFVPKFSWRLIFWSWRRTRTMRTATESYKKEKNKFGTGNDRSV